MGFALRRGHDGVMAHEPTQALPSPGVRILLTEVGLRAREQELDQLRAIKRDDIGRRLRDARGYGEPGAPGVVGIGSVVTVDETNNGAGARYRLVGSHEAEQAGDVSIGSPVGQALLGRRASETVTVSLPDGRVRRLRIVSVAPPT
jgi:transcription elongation GreA/GreB family factor